ncbi:MAG: Rrf2 family transcriptional regulator [Acidobacteria bacterium]|nr:Rrf2 family transcriptional regulator [Acidobacteriota bacterium]
MLRFSLRTEYGLRALMELALRAGEGPVPAREIARGQGIPLRFLEHQLATLHKAGIVQSHRGAGGGCSLARGASEIKIGEVIEVLEGPISAMFCLDPNEQDASCPRTHRCGLQELWLRVEGAVRVVLQEMTVADLVSRNTETGPLLWPIVRATNA